MIAYRYNRSFSARNAQMPDSRNQRTAPTVAWESFRRHARAIFNSGQPRSEDRPKISTRRKGHMKLIFTALIALCTVAATFADEGKFGPAWVEGHNYKVVDGQLVEGTGAVEPRDEFVSIDPHEQRPYYGLNHFGA
jgi:hypothetical protein